MNELKIFEKTEFGSVRVVMKEGEPWFVAKDVCNALGYVWKGVATIGHIPEEWRGVYSVQTPSGEQEMLILSEPGLVFNVALPQFRRELPPCSLALETQTTMLQIPEEK